MKTSQAINLFSALSQETRLAVFRLLIKEGPAGLPAGEIAAHLGAHASTMSSHLSQLERAGLLMSWRVQRQIFYASNIDGVKQILNFLIQDCCNGQPELCDGIDVPCQISKTCKPTVDA